MNGATGYTMTDNSSSQASAKKKVKTANGKARKYKILCIVSLILQGGYMVYVYKYGGFGADQIREFIERLKFVMLPQNAFGTLIMIIVRFFLTRVFSKTAFTDLMLIAVFDAADDKMKAKHTGTNDEDEEKLCKEWHTICPQKIKRKSKKKKKKGKKGKKGDRDSESEYSE